MAAQMLLLLAGGLLVVNLLAYAAFALDKRRARTGAWRIPEATLLALAAIGGSAGAKLAQRHYRHKTQKQPFRTRLNAICALQVAALVVLCVPDLRAGLAAMLGALP